MTAHDPSALLRSRREGLGSPGGCAPNWLILEHRWHPDEAVVDESDAVAFLEVRSHLSTVGVNLVDAVLFDSEFHYWSMHDLERRGGPYRLWPWPVEASRGAAT